MEIIVSSGFGIETATKIELKKLGIDAPCDNGRFAFEGGSREIALTNLHLRTADRVLVKIAEFEADTFDRLYEGMRAINWQDILTPDAKIVVNAKSVQSKLFALSSIQSVGKKAIVDKLTETRRFVPEDGAPYLIDIGIARDRACVTIDTSGIGLHKRGYRRIVWEAPLRETIASAILQLSVWKPDRQLIDPFCGSGTIPVEAAMIGLKIPSGYFRNFAFEGYGFVDNSQLEQEKKIASEAIDWDSKLRISGFDIDKRAIKIANSSVQAFGLEKYIHLEVADMRTVRSRFKYGVLVTNPPYGERLGTQTEARELYRALGELYRSLDDWSAYVITSDSQFERYFGKRADKTRKLFNATLECRLYQYLGAKPPTSARGQGVPED